MTLLSEEEGLIWQSGVATLRGTQIKFRLSDLQTLDIQTPCPFKVGMRFEAIDPRHQSTFCVASVAEVLGSRMRVHLDGYPDVYDFWLNHDSWGIFPCGFCESSGRTLSVPPSEGTTFSWSSYLRRIGAQAAPRVLFRPHGADNGGKCAAGVSIGDRLEAKQRRAPFRWGVAQVIDRLAERILVHFDGTSGDDYDQWYILDSPYIGSVGHCDRNEVSLSVLPPTFTTWAQYLREQQSKSIVSPQRREPHSILLGATFEVVDPYNRRLIRRAQVVKVKPFSVQLRFEGWTQSYHDFWVDADSEDLHDPGWCVANVHPLEPSGPARRSEACSAAPGCRGLGSVQSPGHTTHNSPQFCPYARHNVERILPRRVETRSVRGWGGVHLGHKAAATGENTLRRAVHDSIFACLPPPSSLETDYRRKNNLQGTVTEADVEQWDVARVANEVSRVTGLPSLGNVFRQNAVDGVALLCLRREDLTDVLRLKLGVALKVHSLVAHLQ
ncbi:lethal(3)malignant brain tumor-like protein 4 [Varroa jacobsoni]|uniref:SAM domain-containing protein n=1 Tax=Varroa destructor TaxID=109461 RepID=A0A7M7J6L2_VARDE|nr:lethal(3)malignant brain tumor-like protein 4 [Varroa destructor]XP_022695804.1 lethal(3)malignant brain tumor-like protein 4 [Varroa jacobsoni]